MAKAKTTAAGTSCKKCRNPVLCKITMFMRIFKLSVHLAHITPRSRRPLIQRSSTSRIIVRLCTIAIRASSDEHKRPLRTQLQALRRGWAGFDKSLFLSNETDYFIVENDGDEDVERMIINLFNWSLSAGWVARQFDVIIDHEAEGSTRSWRCAAWDKCWKVVLHSIISLLSVWG